MQEFPNGTRMHINNQTAKMELLNQKLIFNIKLIDSLEILKKVDYEQVENKWDKEEKNAYRKYYDAKENKQSDKKINDFYNKYKQILNNKEKEKNKINKELNAILDGCKCEIQNLYNQMLNIEKEN